MTKMRTPKALLRAAMLIPVIGVSLIAASQTRATAGPQLMFGMGTELSGDLSAPLVQQAPMKLLTSWYNTPGDLSWMSSWQGTVIPKAYAAGYALQLVIWTGVPEVQLTTNYGPACGRPYPLSSGFLSDMQQLATIWAGSGPLYISMFAEFQTYPCVDNQWAGNENYYRALKDQYMAAKAIFHQYAPNARVALNWGGWQTRWNDPAHGGGLSLFPYFADVMSASDYQSFQAMDSTDNAADVQSMTKVLGAYGPVMLSYYKPNSGSQTTFDADTQTMLTDSYLAQATANGLFAFAFMDNHNLSASTTTFDFVKNAVTRYAAPWIVPPSPSTSSTPPPSASSTAPASATSTPTSPATTGPPTAVPPLSATSTAPASATSTAPASASSPPTSPATSVPLTATTTPAAAVGANAGEDTFSRVDQAGWGTTTNPDGVPSVAWGMDGDGTHPFVTIGNNTALYGYPGSTNVVGIASAGSTTYNGGDSLVKFAVSAVGHVTPYVVQNACSDKSCYYGARLHTSQNRLELAKRAGNVTTILASVPVTAGANTVYWMRLDVVAGSSTMLQARIWADGTPEPSSWMVSVTDSRPLAANLIGTGGSWDLTGTGESIQYACYAYAASGLAAPCGP